MKNIALAKNEWRFAYKRDDEVRTSNFDPKSVACFLGTETYEAAVPGCFEYNLYRADLLPIRTFRIISTVFAGTRVIISGIIRLSPASLPAERSVSTASTP